MTIAAGLKALVAGEAGDGEALPQVLPARRLGGPMPWIIAIMALLTVLAAGAALATMHFASQARAGLAGGALVSVTASSPKQRDREATAALAALSRAPGVSTARRVTDAELEQLVEPWLGDIASSEAVTLPALIDVSVDGPLDAERLGELRRALASAAPGATIEAQADWLGPVFDAIRALRLLAFTAIALLLAASMAAVWLAARNAFDANRETIAIVHQLGANDRQIATLFQRSVLMDAAIGAVLGLVIGAGGLAVMGSRFGALQSGLVAGGALGIIDWLLIALVPVIMTFVAAATARRTVLVQLEKML